MQITTIEDEKTLDELTVKFGSVHKTIMAYKDKYNMDPQSVADLKTLLEKTPRELIEEILHKVDRVIELMEKKQTQILGVKLKKDGTPDMRGKTQYRVKKECPICHKHFKNIGMHYTLKHTDKHDAAVERVNKAREILRSG